MCVHMLTRSLDTHTQPTQGVLRKVTTFGAGLLIGTALMVIIPEGVESLFGEGGVQSQS